MRKLSTLVLILAGAVALSLIGLRKGQTQSAVLRRVTNTTEEGINLNPSISGDGKVLAFESTEDIAAAGGNDHFRAIRANVANDPATFFQMGGTRAVAPAISQDGSRIAFASKDDPLAKNLDGNSEIFLLDGAELTQVTNTSPGDLADRVTNGSFAPSISDDGRFIAFSSNRDLAGQNSDGNLEIFIYDVSEKSFAQLTNTSGIVGSSDAKISGDAASVAYILDNGATPSSQKDLVEKPRLGLGAPKVLTGNVQSLAMTYGRAISDDGTRIVYSAQTAINTTQVFLYDGRSGAGVKQITSLGARTTEVPLYPTISGDGARIAFATRRSVTGAPANPDGGVELYLFDIPSAQLSKITSAPSSATADVVSSLNDDGSLVAFNFPRVLSGPLTNGELSNHAEIYLTATPRRPAFGLLNVVNGASFGKEPSTTKAVAPDSIAVAIGGTLANSTRQSQRLADGTFPTNVDGTTVTVNGRAAEIFFVSSGQVNFLVPPQTEIGNADVVITNSENFASRGTVPILRAAPGLFTKSGDGSGPGVILTSDFLQEGPFDPTDGNLRLTIFATGARSASQNSVVLGGRVLNTESVIPSPDMSGLDEIDVRVPRDLRGAGTVDMFIQSDGRASNPVSITFVGDAIRDVLINEALADPPDGIAGDANHDGVRDSSDDEFIELVNTTTHDIDISGYQLRSRSSSTTTDSLRHTFGPGTILPGCAAVVVFGGGAFNPNDAAFAGALVVKASSGALSLTNGGGGITLRDPAGETITSLSWGGPTGLSGDANQSITRSPDINGNFIAHHSAVESAGRSFSPGTKVDGSAFSQCNPIVRIDVTPPSAVIDAGRNQQFTARVFNASGDEVQGVIFLWQTSNTEVATIDQNGLATSLKPGVAEIRVSARGLQSAAATLNVREVQRMLTHIEVTPASATIPAGGAQQFAARGIDQFGNDLNGLTFSWESTDPRAATIDQTGLANGVSPGQATIRASAQDTNGTATLNVTAPTIVVNEVLADPPTGADGDANHDGTRDSAQDEFVELINSTNTAIDLSGWTLRTHSSSSSTETVRHTFAPTTTLGAGAPVAVFGGGTFNSNDPLFGCALVVKASSGGLSLTNSGLTILVRDASGHLITQFSYGGVTGLNGGIAQSLTRSPDIKGNFALHTNISGRKFSAGLRVDGTPFGDCTGHPVSLTISPPSNNITVGQTTPITAQAFDQFGRAMIGVDISFASDNTRVATVDSVSTNPGNGIATANVSAHNPGTSRITASTTDGTNAISAQAIVSVTGPTLTINDVTVNEGDSGPRNFTFTLSLSTPAPAGGVRFNIATQDATATTADDDYDARALTGQTIPAGQSTFTFDVTVNGDLRIEPNETFIVNVTDVSGASLGDGQGIGTIVNDDSPLLSIHDVAAREGDTGGTKFTFTVTATLPAPPGGITFDIATADGTATAAGDDFVARNLKHETIPAGQTSYAFEVIVKGDTLVEPNETFTVNLANVVGAGVTDGSGLGTIQNDDSANLVISQVFGGGDNAGAPFRNDFVEIYNHGTTTVDFAVTPYSIQYASVGANFGVNKTNLTTGALLPGRYFLIQEAGGTTNGSALPAPDVAGAINMSSTTGKVALVVGTAFLSSGSCPGDDGAPPFNGSKAAIADFVGYGSSASTAGICYEGAGPAAPLSNTTAGFRKASGCAETNDNAADFLVAAPNPRNSNSPVGDCRPEISINDLSVAEGNAGSISANFTVTLSAVSGNSVTVNYATADGTATAPSDYQSTSGLLTFNPGDLSKTITVTVNGDTLDEPNETFFINLSGATNGTLVGNQAQGTINDNDPAPSLSINDVLILEGDTGTAPATFTVKLSAASGRQVTVNYATSDNTAEAGADYQAASGTLTFNPGDTSKPVNVPINGDTAFESDETFFVILSIPTNASISDPQGQGTVINDDVAPPIPTLFIGEVSIPEGDSDTSVATFNVTLSPASNQIVTVDFKTANGTATAAGSDYLSATGTITFNPGDTSKPIKVTINGDRVVEPDETFVINLTNATGGALIGKNQGLGTIQNDDTALLAISRLYGGGGNAGATFQNDFVEIFNRGTTTLDFGITPYSVQYASSSGTFSSGNKVDLTAGALAVGQYYLLKLNSGGAIGATFTADLTNTGVNLSATDGKVALVAGTTVAITTSGCPTGVPVADLVGYGSANCSETTATAALSATKSALRKSDGCTDTNNNLADFTTPTVVAGSPPRNTTSTLHDCNAPPDLTIDDVTMTEGNGGPTTFTFTVSLAAPAPSTVTFDIATQDNTATVANGDYVARSLTAQTIAAGQKTYTFDVTVNGETNVEPNENFFVNVTNVIGANAVDSQGLGTIQNDDSPGLSINDVSLSEGNTGTTTFNFTVSLSQPAPAGGVTFDIATQDRTATTSNDDYVALSLAGQTIPAGQSSSTFYVTVNGDTVVEPSETFLVNVTNVSGATVVNNVGHGTIQNDDTPVMVISQIYGGGGNSGAQFKNDFVEIFNRGTTTVDLGGWSVQQAAATGTTWNVAALCPIGACPVAPGKYFLLAEGSGGATGSNLPAPDSTGTANFAVSGTKIALVTNNFALTGSGCPFGPAVVDFVGYGSADCFEGSNKATAHSNTTAGFRKSGGCVDSNDNLSDFAVAAPMPRNSSSAANDCTTGFRPDITINDISVTEGDSGTKTVDFTVTLSAANNTQAVTLNYATADGSATAGADYESTSGTLIFNPTETSKTITVTINGDLLDEPNETLLINLSNAANATILDNQGQGTITDNDPTPSLSINDLTSIPEGDNGTSTANFTVILSATSGQTVTVNYATADGTANAGSDYVASSGTLTFNPGELTKQIPITINGDQTFEPNESFFVNLTGPVNATISDSQGQATITNDDAAPPTPNITIDDPSVAEGDVGSKTLDFTVSLSIPGSSTVTVDYATASTAPAKATAGVDYLATSGTITFDPGQTIKQVSITINGDQLVEPNETFFVDLTNASSGSTITDSEGTGTIANDDTPFLVISQVYGGGGNSGATYIADFIEIFNRGSTTVDFAVTPYSIQYAAASSAFGAAKTDVTSGTLAPGHYFLIQEASGGAAGAALPIADTTGTINLAATAGKVALVTGTILLSTTSCPGDDGVTPFNPSSPAIADFLGYGSLANCYEGPGPVSVSSTNANARAVVRTSSCIDTNVNSADFSNPTSAPFARNSSSPLTSCP
jgi:uncharacterized protein (TIGR03437 family)